MTRKRVFPLILCILILLTTAIPAAAAETGSVTVLFQYKDQPVAGAQFQIYKAADWNGGGYTLVAPFSGYAVAMPGESASEEWKALASTLAAYAARDGLAPMAVGEVDGTGTLRFENLEEGLYLVTGSPAVLGDLMIFPQPMLVCVPYTKTGGEKDYEVVTEPKYEVREPEKETVTRRALKIWKDSGNKEKRPHDITVQLLRDGEIYDEQVLSADNNWAYTWEGLDAGHDWQLTEKAVPEDYTVEITRQGITVTVTNTNDNPPPPTEPTPWLPQTGQVWWPVPVLAGVGSIALFFGILLLLRRREDAND